MVCFQVACTENSHLSFCTGADRNHVRTAFFIGSPAVRQRGPGWAAYAPEKLLLTSCPYSPGTPGRLQASQDARRAVEARGFFEPCGASSGFLWNTLRPRARAGGRGSWRQPRARWTWTRSCGATVAQVKHRRLGSFAVRVWFLL